MNGPLEIAGHVAGSVVVINGDVRVLASGVVDGSITAAGGTVRVDPAAHVSGPVAAYRELLHVRVDVNDQLVYVSGTAQDGVSAGYDLPFGRTDVLLAVRGAYNRVEGLPIALGPRLRLGSSTPTRLQALAIVRTAADLDFERDRFGYVLAADQYLNRSVWLEARAFNEVREIEDWGLSNREASLAAFVVHDDYRDHYSRRGWSAGMRFQRPGGAFRAGIDLLDETDRSVTPADPFTVIYNGAKWRAEPIVAEGRLHSITALTEYDTRNDQTDPADGWYIRASVEQGLGGSIDEFTTAHFDVRRYARLTPYSRIALRIVAAGSVDGGALPAQRQHTLGGVGSLPAYSLLAFDCGARRPSIEGTNDFVPYHGCDRLALAQVEYQASFPYARRAAEALGLSSWLASSVRWAAFFDAGRVWTEPQSLNGRTRGRTDFSADAGLGLRLGPLGLYWALPLSGSEHPYNFFLRLSPRL
jgi:hypothetical protein